MKPFPVAVITGGSRRIGAAICKYLHSNNFNIVIHYNKSKISADELAQQLNSIRPDSAKTFQADLNDFEKINNLALFSQSAWGRVDALINNASSFFPTSVTDALESDWDNLLNSNLKAPFFLSQKLHRALKKKGGCIVNIGDIFAKRPMPNHSIYSIAKAGNRMLTQALALELAPEVRVNGVAPGAILWPENEFGNAVENTDKLRQIPLARLGGAEAVAKAVHFLIQSSPYTTGEILRVDGGRSLI